MARPTPMPRAELARYFVESGYAVVFQDCRGRHRSEGTFEKYTAEAEDGYDTVAWIHARPWCNGRIGTMGLSYAAHTQAALAALDPPGLAAMVLDSGGFSNAYQGGIRQGGAFELKQATWAWKQAKESPEAQADPLIRAALEAEDIRAWFTRMPWRPGRSPVRWAPDYERYLLEQWSHGVFDDVWRRPGLCASAHYDAFTDCPTVIMSSWYDAYVATATENYVGLKGRKKGPYRLIMGPWLHGDRTLTHAGDISFGPAAAIDGNVAETWRAFRLGWFDRWLKDGPASPDDPPVRLFLMGGGSGRRDEAGRLEHGGRWIEASDWPVPEARPTPFYLHADGGLSSEPPEEEGTGRSYVFDPADPVPTIGGSLTSGEPVFSGGGFDQREDPRFFGCKAFGLPLSARAGRARLRDGAAAARRGRGRADRGESLDLLGRAGHRFHGQARGCLFPVAGRPERLRAQRYGRNPALPLSRQLGGARSLEPGRPVRIVIRPFATANLFKSGHRIRIDVSSSNFPKYDVNPNSFEPEGQAETPRKAMNRVWMDRTRPSHVVLPILRA